jgi:hypothetical protein
MSYRAYHVELSGIPLASYDLMASDDEAAKSEARHYLSFHPSIEVWEGPRRVARLVPQEPATASSCA